MELSDAVEKAADEMVRPMVGMALTPSGPAILDHTFEGKHNFEYLQYLRPLVKKWSAVVGQAIEDKAVELGEFEKQDHRADDGDVQPVINEFDAIYDTVGVDIACGVFALGYQLGDPVYDKQEHDKKTFHTALADRATQQILITRFRGESFLRERFSRDFKSGGDAISHAFSSLNLPHTQENVNEWGKLSTIFCFYEAFQVGLRARRIWEEDMAFDQIARGLED